VERPEEFADSWGVRYGCAPDETRRDKPCGGGMDGRVPESETARRRPACWDRLREGMSWCAKMKFGGNDGLFEELPEYWGCGLYGLGAEK